MNNDLQDKALVLLNFIQANPDGGFLQTYDEAQPVTPYAHNGITQVAKDQPGFRIEGEELVYVATQRIFCQYDMFDYEKAAMVPPQEYLERDDYKDRLGQFKHSAAENFNRYFAINGLPEVKADQFSRYFKASDAHYIELRIPLKNIDFSAVLQKADPYIRAKAATRMFGSIEEIIMRGLGDSSHRQMSPARQAQGIAAALENGLEIHHNYRVSPELEPGYQQLKGELARALKALALKLAPEEKGTWQDRVAANSDQPREQYDAHLLS